ncbi:ATP synthase membrane subunit K, mitochondrial-like [Vulpes lagopus]|uniref:ATP synthase membrane subunit K, mitochondrial-like n=1 Tax=Vulpes lagopus TaxID=494514 RepID=UPI001BC9BEDE|nr:ATP synthase membrane subunit K, mitochondrial-like [Vulpes lagopus]
MNCTLKDITSGIGIFCKIKIMTSPEMDAQIHFTDIKKHFNSYTLTGRMNWVLTTYEGIALMILYFKLRSTKAPTVKAT